jgi:hypothetical protein
VQDPLLEAVVSVLAAPGLPELLRADRPASAGGGSRMSSSTSDSAASTTAAIGTIGGGIVSRQQFVQAALSSATKLIGVSGLEPVLLRHVTALVSHMCFILSSATKCALL